MYRHRNAEELERINISDYIREFLVHIRKKEGRVINANHLGSAMHMKELLNDPRYTAFKSVKDVDNGFSYWSEQKVDYVPSNLGRGKGYLFYFICNGCNRRVKYLYEYNLCYSPLCRTCCRLKYKAPTRKARELSRLIRKPYLSGEAKYMLIKRAGLTVQDVLDSEK